MNATLNPRDHLRALDQALINSLLNEARPPCISIYMPTHRGGPQTRENPIRYKSCLQQAQDSLSQIDKHLAERLVGALMDVVDDHHFWQHQLDALALFADAETFHFVRLPRPIARETTIVADSYHVKPLVRIMQTLDRYQLLAITQKSVTLYEGNRDHLDVLPLHPEVPRTLVEALGPEVRGNLNVNSYGGLAHNGMFHGHHDNKDERDSDLERFFRVIDKALYDYHGRNSDLPLYLACDVDYHDRFRKVSHHPRLQKQGVRINPEAPEVDTERLKKEMNEIILPAMHERTRDLFEKFGTAKARGLGSDDIAKVAEAAVGGRVHTLLLSADKTVGGRIDRETGQFRKGKVSDPEVDDALDDLAELGLRTGAQVMIVPGDVHPTDSGVAAIFRY